MADSNITVSALAVTSGIGHNFAQWSFSDPNSDGLFSLKLDAVELWAASTNDRSAAAKVAEGRDSAGHFALTQGATRYYWIKARNNAGRYGDWYPAGATSGVSAVVYWDSEEWVSYTPTVTAGAGTLTSVTDIAGRYKIRGRSVLVHASATIANNGTGASGIIFSAPVEIDGSAVFFMGVGRADVSEGMCFVQAEINTGVHELHAFLYDGTHPVVGGSGFINIQIEYEMAV